jgi:hypothetical protein
MVKGKAHSIGEWAFFLADLAVAGNFAGKRKIYVFLLSWQAFFNRRRIYAVKFC